MKIGVPPFIIVSLIFELHFFQARADQTFSSAVPSPQENMFFSPNSTYLGLSKIFQGGPNAYSYGNL